MEWSGEKKVVTSTVSGVMQGLAITSEPTLNSNLLKASRTNRAAMMCSIHRVRTFNGRVHEFAWYISPIVLMYFPCLHPSLVTKNKHTLS